MGGGAFSQLGRSGAGLLTSVSGPQTTFCDYREEGLDRRQSSQVTWDWETGQLVVSWVGHL